MKLFELVAALDAALGPRAEYPGLNNDYDAARRALAQFALEASVHTLDVFHERLNAPDW